MTPEPFLTDRGLSYFDSLVLVLTERGMNKPEYAFQLSMLCNEMDKYVEIQEHAAQRVKDGFPAWLNQGSTHQIQENGLSKRSNQTLSNIQSMCVKFGLNPKDWEAIVADVKKARKGEKEEEEKPKEETDLIKQFTIKRAV